MDHSTPKTNGHYDFFTGLIALDKLSNSDLSSINLALAELPPPLNTPQVINLRDIRALVKHEVTHFLDHTTTIWGVEFLYRRNCLIQSIEKGGTNTEERLAVYLLNIAELQMHRDLIKIHKDIPFKQCNTIKHQLVHNKQHGAIVIIKFFQDGELISDVPLSMLSLIEANAIANEYLSRFDDLIHMAHEEKSIAEAAVERKLQKILNEPNLSEYSVLITLARIGFTFLDTRQLLSYVSVLANFCLNVTALSLGGISELIRDSFNNKEIGNGIWVDLSRGMSRHVIAFKTILFMHSWIEKMPTKKRQACIEIMKTNPYEAIEIFWCKHGKNDPMGYKFELSALILKLNKSQSSKESNITCQAIVGNKKWQQQRNLRNCHFDEITCLDILLGDDSVVQYPQRIDFDVFNYSYEIVKAYTKVERIIGASIKKFHMPLQQASAMLETILTQKDVAQPMLRQTKSRRWQVAK